MSFNYEVERHIGAATPDGKRDLRAIGQLFKSVVRAKNVPELPREITLTEQAEPLVLPTTDQLMTASQADLRGFFGRDMEIAEPPQELFSDVEKLAEIGIRVSTPDIYATPYFEFKRNMGKDDISGWTVRPQAYFWDLIDDGNLSKDAATLQAAWHIDLDPKGKPEYENGQQMYEDDYLAKYMARMRNAKLIDGSEDSPEGTRFLASPDQIEGVIIPVFTVITGVEGEVNYKSYMGYNFRGNEAHPEWGKTRTAEWFRDKVGKNGAFRLFGGYSGLGGLADVHDWRSDLRFDYVGFSLEIVYPSQPR